MLKTHPTPTRKGGKTENYSADPGSRTKLGSTAIPGPIVVEMVAFLIKRPLEDDGLAR
jgi:hypothetical protein